MNAFAPGPNAHRGEAVAVIRTLRAKLPLTLRDLVRRLVPEAAPPSLPAAAAGIASGASKLLLTQLLVGKTRPVERCVVRWFDDLWYPAADDLEIFDASCSWLVSVAHDGAVGVVRF